MGSIADTSALDVAAAVSDASWPGGRGRVTQAARAHRSDESIGAEGAGFTRRRGDSVPGPVGTACKATVSAVCVADGSAPSSAFSADAPTRQLLEGRLAFGSKPDWSTGTESAADGDALDRSAVDPTAASSLISTPLPEPLGDCRSLARTVVSGASPDPAASASVGPLNAPLSPTFVLGGALLRALRAEDLGGFSTRVPRASGVIRAVCEAPAVSSAREFVGPRSSAHAGAGVMPSPRPIPRATATPPTRPIHLRFRIFVPFRRPRRSAAGGPHHFTCRFPVQGS